MKEIIRATHRLACGIGLLTMLSGAIPAIGAPGASISSQDTATFVQILPDPDRVAFETQVGSTADLTADISLSSSDGGPLAYTASVQTGNRWLELGNVFAGLTTSVSNTISATAPGSLRVVAAVAGLPAGTYNGTIALTAPGTVNSPKIITVTLVVRNHPTVILRPNILQFSHRKGYDFNTPKPQTISVFGMSSDFQVLVSAEPSGWITVSTTAGTTPADVTVSVDPSSLDSGLYEATISIVAPNAGSVATATVSLSVLDGVPSPTISPNAVSFQTLWGSHQPLSKTILVSTNDDILPLANSSADASWLSVQAVDQWAGVLDGETFMVLPQPGRLVISADPTGLAPGTYSGLVTIGSLSYPAIPVTLRIFSNNLVLPQVVAGGDWNTTITLVNTDAVPAPFTVRFWRQDGTPLSIPLDGIGPVSSYSDQIPVGGTRTLKTNGSDFAVSSGWAEVLVQNSVGGSAVLQQHGASASNEATLRVGAPTGKHFALPFDNLGGYQTGVALANTGSVESTVTVAVYDENGNRIASDSINLPAHGAQALFLKAKYPQLINRRGEITYDSNVDLSATALRFSSAGAFTVFQPTVSDSTGPTDVTTQSVPRIFDGTGWKTTLFLMNPGSNPVSFSIAFRDPTAPEALLSLPILGLGETSEYSDVIPPGGMRVIETPGTSDSLVQGWAEIVSSGPLAGTAVFEATDGSGTDMEAAIQVQPGPGEHFVLPFDNTAGYVTTMTVLDTNQLGWTGIATVRDENGRELDIKYFQTNSTVDQTFILSDLYPATSGIRGTVEFVGVYVSILESRFSLVGAFALLAPIPK